MALLLRPKPFWHVESLESLAAPCLSAKLVTLVMPIKQFELNCFFSQSHLNLNNWFRHRGSAASVSAKATSQSWQFFFSSLAKQNKAHFPVGVTGLEGLYISSLPDFPCVFASQDMLTSFNKMCQKGRKMFSSYRFIKKKKKLLAPNWSKLYKYNSHVLTGEKTNIMKTEKDSLKTQTTLDIRKSIKRHKP